MSEELIINVSDFETRVALLEEGCAQEVHLARANSYSLTGNIYLGRVERIIPGMQAAFVNVGLERPGFLHARELDSTRVIMAGDADPTPDIRRLLHEGQEIMVQIAKDPISSKGARLTTQLAIASRFLVLMPFNDHIGISQRIEDEAGRDGLRTTIDELRNEQNVNLGFIARTASDGADRQALAADMRLLVRMWDKIMKNRHASGCPGLVYQEIPLHIRVVRDLAGPNLSEIHIDHRPTYARVRDFVQDFLPEFNDRLRLHAGPRDLFEQFGVDEEITRALEKKVALKSGGHLIIEQTEAMITIDVNTGGYLGVDNLEETVFRTNMEAASSIPRQLRLRNLGGIIVVDFIDMQEEEHQRQVLHAFEKACETDPARIHIEGFSSLGLVQMSRKRTRQSLQQQLCESCVRCDGHGVVRTAETTCIEIFRAIQQDSSLRCPNPIDGPLTDPMLNGARSTAADQGEYLIRAPESIVDRLLDEDAIHLSELGKLIGRDVRIQVEPSYGPGQFDIVLVQGVKR